MSRIKIYGSKARFSVMAQEIKVYKYQGYMSFRKLIEEIRYSKKCRELNYSSRDNGIIANPRYRIGHYMSGKNKRKGGKRNVSHNKPK